MGILSELMKMDLSYIPAFEADDVTGAAQAAAANIGDSNGGNDATDDAVVGADGDDDMSQTDDIFGIQANKNSTNATDNNSPDNSDNNDNSEDDSETGDEDPNVSGDDSENNEDPSLNDTSDDNSDKPEFYDKNKLKKNMVALYKVIKANTKMMSELLAKMNDEHSIQVCNNVINNLNAATKCLYTDLTEDMESKPYEELLRDYITVKRIFDLCTEILSKHFDNVSIISNKKKNDKRYYL